MCERRLYGVFLCARCLSLSPRKKHAAPHLAVSVRRPHFLLLFPSCDASSLTAAAASPAYVTSVRASSSSSPTPPAAALPLAWRWWPALPRVPAGPGRGGGDGDGAWVVVGNHGPQVTVRTRLHLHLRQQVWAPQLYQIRRRRTQSQGGPWWRCVRISRPPPSPCVQPCTVEAPSLRALPRAIVVPSASIIIQTRYKV